MSAPIPFNAAAPGIAIAVTTVASATTLLPAAGNSVRLVNEGPNHAYVSIGEGSQTATVPGTTAEGTCCVVLAGTDITLTIQSDQPSQISAITKTGTTALDVYVGEGV
ncbi:hypothetical protein [Burkholderia sp. Bp8995]|uniref:hypothetical protein n=1 Tax=Burkholderia sp. Bp8995 TaxID=2184556 RepID=UPI000F59AD23|nr:hypothetical protein [Burkholderia sp. Bp8995]RQS22420.1 hypothetical protein DIE05_29780 [Burkholderia sp. Bp8995]